MYRHFRTALSSRGSDMSKSEFDDAYDDVERLRGEILATTIDELSPNAPIMVDASATVVAAVDAMNTHRTGCVLVQKEGKLVGIFTERDVLTRVIFRDNNRSVPVERLMTPNPDTLQPTATVAYALNQMSVGGFRHVPIVNDKGEAVGVLSMRDIVDFLVRLFPRGVFNLPHSPTMAIPRTMDGG
jgi:CBS domain-containing protein